MNSRKAVIRTRCQLLRAAVAGVALWFAMSAAIAQEDTAVDDEESSSEVLDEIIVKVASVRRLDLPIFKRRENNETF